MKSLLKVGVAGMMSAGLDSIYVSYAKTDIRNSTEHK